MRIALVSPYSWTYPGGVTRHIEALAAELQTLGHETRILAPYDPDDALARRLHRGARPQPLDPPEGFVSLGRTFGLPANGAVSNITGLPTAVLALRRELRDGGYDVAHLHEPVVPLVCWEALTHAGDLPLVGTFHTYSENPVSNGIAAVPLGGRWRMNHLRVRIAVSEAAAWTARRFYGGRYRIVPNGVHLDGGRRGQAPPEDAVMGGALFGGAAVEERVLPEDGNARAYAPARVNDVFFVDHPFNASAAGNPPADGPSPLRILFVGQAVERKGLPMLLRAFEALRDHVPATLTLVGATAEEVAHMILDGRCIQALGKVSEERKLAELAQADVLCAPSLHGESFGMVLTEGLAAGTPVLASDIPGYRDVLRDGIDGQLLPAGDPLALAEALRRLALEPARRTRMAIAARERAERFAWPHVAAEVLECYERAIAIGRPATRLGRFAVRHGLAPADLLPRVPAQRLPSLQAQSHVPAGSTRSCAGPSSPASSSSSSTTTTAASSAATSSAASSAASSSAASSSASSATSASPPSAASASSSFSPASSAATSASPAATSAFPAATSAFPPAASLAATSASPASPAASSTSPAAAASFGVLSAGAHPGHATSRRTRMLRRVGLATSSLLGGGLAVLALQRIGVTRVAASLLASKPGLLAAGLAVMCAAMFARALAWHAILAVAPTWRRAKRRDAMQGTFIGVLMSATLPARLGEPSRALIVARRLGRARETLPVVLGTMVSQTLLNLLALAILGSVAISSVSILDGHDRALLLVALAPLAVLVAILLAPVLLPAAAVSRSQRLQALVATLQGVLLRLRDGLRVFRRPRPAAIATCTQLGAWALQWLSCWLLLMALGLNFHASAAAAAGVLFAVNVTAVIPATPANIGVFQAACVAVLAGAYHVATADAIAYGIVLQAVEVSTALLMGIPALLNEGLSWRDVRLRTMHAAPVTLAPLPQHVSVPGVSRARAEG